MESSENSAQGFVFTINCYIEEHFHRNCLTMEKGNDNHKNKMLAMHYTLGVSKWKIFQEKHQVSKIIFWGIDVDFF